MLWIDTATIENRRARRYCLRVMNRFVTSR
jgi:hypothetical protein